MLHRIRLAMQDETLGSKLSGEVEADETFIGGKARNMHKSVKNRRITGWDRRTHDKIIVMGMLERGGRVRTQVVADRVKTRCIPSSTAHRSWTALSPMNSAAIADWEMSTSIR